MAFLEDIIKRAKEQRKTIVLPETEDIRTLQATEKILKEGFAKIILVGNKEKTEELANQNNINIEGAIIIDPAKSEKYDEYVNKFFELRQKKGISIEKAKEIMLNNVYFGMMMVKCKDMKHTTRTEDTISTDMPERENKLSFAHRVDPIVENHYRGWNIPSVEYWMPFTNPLEF